MKKLTGDPYHIWQKYFLNHSQARVLKKLEELIQSDGGLFNEDPSHIEFRKLSLLFRIDVLIGWGRYAEALAWLCLETELNPDNYTAHALKEQLKKKLFFTRGTETVSVNPKDMSSIFDWSGIAGMRKLKAIIERDILLPFREPKTYKKYNLKLPKGLLLYGPPGCGKTFIVKKLAKLLGFNFMEVGPSSIGSIYIHGTQGKIKELFDEAVTRKPTLLFIDEFESFVPDRNQSDLSHHYQSEVNEFLNQLNTAFERGVFVVSATNYINKIDPAIIRPGRIDKKIFVGPPDYEARIEAFKTYLKNRPINVTRWDYLSEETEYFTFAEIEFIVAEAARSAKEKACEIDLNLLMIAVKNNPPYLNESNVGNYM